MISKVSFWLFPLLMIYMEPRLPIIDYCPARPMNMLIVVVDDVTSQYGSSQLTTVRVDYWNIIRIYNNVGQRINFLFAKLIYNVVISRIMSLLCVCGEYLSFKIRKTVVLYLVGHYFPTVCHFLCPMFTYWFTQCVLRQNTQFSSFIKVKT